MENRERGINQFYLSSGAELQYKGQPVRLLIAAVFEKVNRCPRCGAGRPSGEPCQRISMDCPMRPATGATDAT